MASASYHCQATPATAQLRPPAEEDSHLRVLQFNRSDTVNPSNKEDHVRDLEQYWDRLGRAPSRAGLWWLAERAGALRTLEEEFGQEVTSEETMELLAGAWLGAWEELMSSLRYSCDQGTTPIIEACAGTCAHPSSGRPPPPTAALAPLGPHPPRGPRWTPAGSTRA
jgi:hypothetical protein